MIDLFGMGQKEPPEPQAPGAAPEPADEPRAPRGSHRLWAFLLVLDAIFVIVFGGAVAAKVYQYWKAPAVATAAPARPRPRPKASDAPKPAEPAASAPAKPAEPPKPAPEKEKPASKAEAAHHPAEAPRPPKPSLLTEGPKPHQAPAPVGAAAAPAPAPAPAAPAAAGKALPVVFKLHAPNASNVQLVGAFIVRGGRKDMTKNGEGFWTVKLYLNPGQYRYFYAVDKKKTLDPENPRADRGASVLTVP